MTQNYAKIIIELYFYNLSKRPRAAQIPLTGHMRPLRPLVYLNHLSFKLCSVRVPKISRTFSNCK